MVFLRRQRRKGEEGKNFVAKGQKAERDVRMIFGGLQILSKVQLKKEAGTQKQKMLYATHRENESFVSKILRYRTMSRVETKLGTAAAAAATAAGGGRGESGSKEKGK